MKAKVHDGVVQQRDRQITKTKQTPGPVEIIEGPVKKQKNEKTANKGHEICVVQENSLVVAIINKNRCIGGF